MGNQKWTATEEQALSAGEEKWMKILNDPKFSSALSDLKDKWHNLTIGTSGEGAEDQSRIPQVTIIPDGSAGVGTSPSMVAKISPEMPAGSPIAASTIPEAPNSAPATSHDDGSSQDKWQNLTIGTFGQGVKDQSESPQFKTSPVCSAGIGISPTMVAGTSLEMSAGSPIVASSVPEAPDSAPATSPYDESSQSVVDADISPPRYNEMIFEALTSINDVNGSQIGAILSFIEQKHEVPSNFRRVLDSKLRRLVRQGKLEKVENRFKLCNETKTVAETPILKPEEAAETATKSVEEAELLKKPKLLAKISELKGMLHFAKEIQTKLSGVSSSHVESSSQ